MSISTMWIFFAGLGIFLYGMSLLESSLKKMAGRTFKLFLKKHTGNKIEAIGSGTIVTAMLQSSSVVSLMVLAFVGAGVMSMRNGLAVVFGSNLGTTLDNWVVALVGFNFNIEQFSLPVIAISGIGLAFVKENKLRNVCEFALGFGLLFLGMHYMKTSIESLLTGFDFSPYADYNRLFFVLLGFIITAIIQSSQATMVIVLSALNTGVIPFHAAVAIVIGSELGTSMKILLGSVGSIPAKKRVALGNTIFNLVITLFAVIFMTALIQFVNFITGGEHPLIALVLFQSAINFTGLIIFYPLLGRFGDFLEKQFTNDNKNATFYISKISPLEPGTAMEAIEKEVQLFVSRVIELNQEAFHIREKIFSGFVPISDAPVLPAGNTFSANYEFIKKSEGEILFFYSSMRKEKMEEEDLKRLDQLIASVRNAMYSAKSMKDIRHNREDFRDSADDTKYRHYKYFQKQLREYFKNLNNIAGMQEKSISFTSLAELLQLCKKDYESGLNEFYTEAGNKSLSEHDLSSLLNVNRELYSSRKSLIHSFKYLLLNESQANDFDALPGNAG